VDEDSSALFIVVVQARSVGLQNIVRLETDHVLQEASELISLRTYLNSRACILVNLYVVTFYTLIDLFSFV
jgi:hypothetical protein